MKGLRWVVWLLPALAVGCVPALESSDFDRGQVMLPLSAAGLTSPVSLTYLGVGGWLIETARTRVLTAPLFSNPSMWASGFGTIEADTVAIVDGLRRFGAPDVSDVSACRATPTTIT